MTKLKLVNNVVQLPIDSYSITFNVDKDFGEVMGVKFSDNFSVFSNLQRTDIIQELICFLDNKRVNHFKEYYAELRKAKQKELGELKWD
jgi:hypothetical protein